MSQQSLQLSKLWIKSLLALGQFAFLQQAILISIQDALPLTFPWGLWCLSRLISRWLGGSVVFRSAQAWAKRSGSW